MSVVTTYTLMSETREEVVKNVETIGNSRNGKGNEDECLENLASFPFIQYSITFRKKSVPVSALIDSDSEVNAIYLSFAQELGLLIRPINIRTQKIDSTILDIYVIVVTVFTLTEKTNQVKFFEETFLVVNISLEVVHGMIFFILSSADVDFLSREL